MNLDFAGGTPVLPPPPAPPSSADGGGRHHYESEQQIRDRELRKRVEEETRIWEIYLRAYSEYRKMIL